MTRRHITFNGWVRGVGFRYRASHADELYGCTGWVKNEWDGSVTIEIQGTEENIDKVILAIERGTYVRIENMDSRTISQVEGESGFRPNEKAQSLLLTPSRLAAGLFLYPLFFSAPSARIVSTPLHWGPRNTKAM